MKMGKDKVIVLGMLLALSICVGIGYSYSYFKAKITYDESKPEVNKVVMANVSASFDGGEKVSLEQAFPGDSISKTFSITNDNSTIQTISINFSSIINTFINDDVVYSIYAVDKDTKTSLVEGTPIPSTTSNTTIALNCDKIEPNTIKTYEIVLMFRETDSDQSVNMNKEVEVNLDITSVDDNNCPVSFTKYLKNLDNTKYDDTSDGNLRFIGKNPNNYVWFNCYDYNDISTCERWRIIGLMNNVETPNGKQNLVKIIRADALTDITGDNEISWDYSTLNEYIGTWDNGEGRATLRSVLNDAYLGYKTIITGYDKGEGTKTYNFTKDKTNTENYRGITVATINKIQQVNWNVSSSPYLGTAKELYNIKDTYWTGFIGLIEPSDYGYATDGGETGRSTCLEYNLYDWSSYGDCGANSWIAYYNPTIDNKIGSDSSHIWTIRQSSDSSTAALAISTSRLTGCSTYSASIVKPTIYLKSDISIFNDSDTDGSYDRPYKII